MRYLSTRGEAPPLEFEDVLLAGLAPDGGLYLPEMWPRLEPADLAAFASMPYADVATRVMAPYVEPAIDENTLSDILTAAYAAFDHRAVAPLIQIERNDWLLELFHGPTFAFKDYALQVLGRLFDHALNQRGERVTIVVATSGDTGSAAIEACRDREAIELFVLHPEGRVSEIQRRQMTTVNAANVHNIAIEGTFDDCQDLVKALFADQAFRTESRLSAVNSINWVRIIAQTVYYVVAAAALGAPNRSVSFSVPTGNFGNVYAGFVARRMGVQIDQLIVATNRNDILARFFARGSMTIGKVMPTISPSMDIQVSSNFERLLFDLLGRDGAAVRRTMETFRQSGRLKVAIQTIHDLRDVFAADRRTDGQTSRIIENEFLRNNIAIDPHTAIGLDVGRAKRRDPAVPLVALATAHPAKFPDAFYHATGVTPTAPPPLADLAGLPERFDELTNDAAKLKSHIRQRISLRGAA